jgi:hypothetical protein
VELRQVVSLLHLGTQFLVDELSSAASSSVAQFFNPADIETFIARRRHYRSENLQSNEHLNSSPRLTGATFQLLYGNRPRRPRCLLSPADSKRRIYIVAYCKYGGGT